MTPTRPVRPVLRWHGGKWLLAPWIIGFFPLHRIYVEPFGGAASVLLRKDRSYCEIYNDLDGEVVNLFRVLQNLEQGGALVRLLELTPFARSEFELAFQRTDDPIERARRLVVRSHLAGGSRGVLQLDRVNAGFNGGSARVRALDANRSHAHDWANLPQAIGAITSRMKGVTIECQPAAKLFDRHDDAETLFYLDPPYLWDTRSKGNRYDIKHYNHEMSDEDHVALLARIRLLKGMVVLSGYGHSIYDEALSDWERHECEAMADGARPRIEVVWINPACAERLKVGTLFERAPGSLERLDERASSRRPLGQSAGQE